MKGKLACAIFWFLTYCVSQSWQATNVTTECSEAEEDAQCYTVSFSRSVFEGHEVPIERDSSASFLLTIYSNTPSTNLLTGYKVTISSSCNNASDLTVTQLDPQMPRKCEAELTTCNSRVTDLLVKVNADTVQQDVFYAQIRVTLRSVNTLFIIRPVTDEKKGKGDGVESSLPDPSDFTPIDIKTTESTGKATTCEIYEPHIRAAQRITTGAIAMICVFTIMLIIAAVAAKVYVLYMDKFHISKVPANTNEEMVAIDTKGGEVSGSYSRQVDF